MEIMTSLLSDWPVELCQFLVAHHISAGICKSRSLFELFEQIFGYCTHNRAGRWHMANGFQSDKTLQIITLLSMAVFGGHAQTVVCLLINSRKEARRRWRLLYKCHFP